MFGGALRVNDETIDASIFTYIQDENVSYIPLYTIKTLTHNTTAADDKVGDFFNNV